jgi:mono/diheme cytochrome c family protein
VSRSLALAAGTALLSLPAAAANPQDQVARGEYLVRAADCYSCHTAPGGQPFAGGRALTTPFGTFYTPNITPDRETGIGAWSDGDFLRALREGVRPDGANYFPAFPYPSFTRITDDDALAMKAYLFSLPPVHQADRPHEVPFPFSLRWLQTGWKFFYFTPGSFRPAPTLGDTYNRGAYLVTALSHCGECHTPRNFLGAPRGDLALAGTPDGPDGQLVPNITPDPESGIGTWDKSDLADLLRTGQTPEQSRVKGAMKEAIADGLKYLTDADRDAIAEYVFAQPPVLNRVTAVDARPWYRRWRDWLVSLTR